MKLIPPPPPLTLRMNEGFLPIGGKIVTNGSKSATGETLRLSTGRISFLPDLLSYEVKKTLKNNEIVKKGREEVTA